MAALIRSAFERTKGKADGSARRLRQAYTADPGRAGLAYGEEEFVPFDEMVGARPASHPIWNPATNLFEVAVFRRNGADLVVKNLPLQTADRLGEAVNDALRERRA